MCKYKSGIILKNKVVLTPIYNDSHSRLLEKLGIEDTYINATKTFVRAELVPPNDDRAVDVKEWKYIVDQDETPEWYKIDAQKYEDDFRAAVEEWVKGTTVVIAGKAWTPIKKEGDKTYYLLNGTLENSSFGNNNNYATSKIRKELNEGALAKELKDMFGDSLVPITTDLTSMDGLKDYGKVEGDILSLMTIDLYRECRENIPNTNWYWLATPDSTPSGYGSDYVRYVYSGGRVVYGDYCYDLGVRPFFILKSSIFEP